ncbi:hypothetical protein NY98_01490 [Xanthomonas citri pv. fuscans]|uniref:MarR family transcriptional regulator n=6 Tax=Xanthomonas TaxID=338 RepID=A0AB33CIB7_XANCI|nr:MULTISPECIES: hypothetical protein [Xanthomonas]MBO9747310.1 hypothetical protein [Xanthomonas phaseoli pv. dieffenbachiae]MBV6782732.1 hypothetical protein [Xanthomonas campestris pv. trichodesmae]MBV6837892.1 hypothetical protein [Xanthomonas campestris pv. merremiae]AMU98914.1 hypothetical protein TP37_13100 [Xanthomonas citri pv. aurantifolii]AMV03822.1 hypothetical protein TP50_16320 [Xanthomonas citri pv. aurantifolii]
MSADPQLTVQLLQVLADAPDGVSLARLCKHLGVRMSVLLRTLAWLGTANLDGQPGPGWVRVEDRGERQFAVLTSVGLMEQVQRATVQESQDD